MARRRAMHEEELERVITHLRAGEVVAVPTDTVYGLGVALEVTSTTEALFGTKHRPSSIAVPVMVADLEQALALCDESTRDALRAVGGAFWPGALTLVIRRDASSTFDLGGDHTTIGIRVPALLELRELCRRVGPLGVTSANLHGGTPCTTPEQLRAVFGEALVILDGGECAGAVSSVVDLTGASPTVLREGAVSLAMVLAALR